jgi:hypothetical protein
LITAYLGKCIMCARISVAIRAEYFPADTSEWFLIF